MYVPNNHIFKNIQQRFKKKHTQIDGHDVFELVTTSCKNCKTTSSVPKPDDSHLIASCLVVLALVGQITDENGKENCIPVTVNPFRNSNLGIKNLGLKVFTTYIFNAVG